MNGVTEFVVQFFGLHSRNIGTARGLWGYLLGIE